MYIEDKLFSENPEEILYSVVLNEEEYALYSEFQKEFTSVRAAKKFLTKVRSTYPTGEGAGKVMQYGQKHGLGHILPNGKFLGSTKQLPKSAAEAVAAKTANLAPSFKNKGRIKAQATEVLQNNGIQGLLNKL